MKIEIEKVNNGIHPYLFLTIKNPESEDRMLIAKIIKLVDEENKQAAKEA